VLKKSITEKQVGKAHNSKFIKYQHVGWGILFLIIILSLLGITGVGPLSTAESSAGQTSVQHNKFGRMQAGQELIVQSSSSAQTVTISKSYLKYFRIDTIQPNPSGVSEEGDNVTFVFGSSSPDINFHITPDKFGWVSGEIRVNKDKISLHQFIYP